ncbi:NAD-dependent epimerase/dehydratase family protein [Stutzerimonas tarimensis]|uniref:NAD-dependent epimerase/dehydratase family protein n=1 Tax=Stutzerimonas tarimensis TaxID=1507735 RepID=A0ABV7T5D6_9GAMM
MSASPRLMIAGCGDVGSRLGGRLCAAGWEVLGLRRQAAQISVPIAAVAGDLQDHLCPSGWPAGRLDYLVYAAAASQHDEAGYHQAYVDGLRHVLGWLEQRGQRPARLLFVSSTGVYGQQDGEWVDESSPTEPQGFSGQVMLEAEQLALGSGLPASVVRLSGLYGPGRRRLIDQVRQGYRVAQQPPLYGNRIHVDDAAALLALLLQADAAGQALAPVYLGVDDAPAPLHEVVDWLRERLGVSEAVEPRPLRRVGSKRCRNDLARDAGWTPRYPSYREGYGGLIDALAPD